MYIKVIKKQNQPNNFTNNFYQAILEIKNRRFREAINYIEKAREILDP